MAVVVIAAGPAGVPAQDKPRAGGTLIDLVGAEPVSLDAHREDSFATVHPMAPFYSLLIKVNQERPSEFEGDLAESKSPQNYGRYKDPVLDQLYESQSRATDSEARRKLIAQFERRVLDEQAHYVPTLWWYRIVPHAAAVKGCQDLRDVWLQE